MKKVIAIIGRTASGKDYAGDFLSKKYGIYHVGISSALRIIARDSDREETRENLIEIGKDVTKKYGDQYLAEIIIKNTSEDFIIISGLRQIGQINYLKKHTSCIFIGIESSQINRYERILNRGKTGEKLNFEDFQKIEKLDEGNIQNVGKCLELCDVIIENNKNLKQFEDELTRASYGMEGNN